MKRTVEKTVPSIAEKKIKISLKHIIIIRLEPTVETYKQLKNQFPFQQIKNNNNLIQPWIIKSKAISLCIEMKRKETKSTPTKSGN